MSPYRLTSTTIVSVQGLPPICHLPVNPQASQWWMQSSPTVSRPCLSLCTTRRSDDSLQRVNSAKMLFIQWCIYFVLHLQGIWYSQLWFQIYYMTLLYVINICSCKLVVFLLLLCPKCHVAYRITSQRKDTNINIALLLQAGSCRKWRNRCPCLIPRQTVWPLTLMINGVQFSITWRAWSPLHAASIQTIDSYRQQQLWTTWHELRQ